MVKLGLLRLLIFFPSITFGLSNTEVFPYAGLYSAIKLRRIRLGLLIIIALLILSVMYGIFIHDNTETIEVFRSLLAYLNPLLVFVTILRVSQEEILKLNRIVIRLVYVFFALSLMQHVGLLGILENVFSFFVPRSSGEAISDVRGVTLLSTEPARAGVEFSFLYFYLRRFKINPRRHALFDFIALAFSLVIFKSATVFFLLGSYLFIAHFRRAVIFFPLALIIIGIALNTIDSRVVVLINNLISMPIEDSSWLIMNTSGHRVISIYAAVAFSMENLFGGGIGFWKLTSLKALELTDVDYMSLSYFKRAMRDYGTISGFRCSGYLTNLLMDMGFGGVIAVLVYLLSEIKKTVGSMKYLIKDEIAFFIIFLVNISIVGSVGAPVPWVVAAIYFRVLMIEKK